MGPPPPPVVIAIEFVWLVMRSAFVPSIQHGMNGLVNGPFREAAHPQHAFFQFVNVALEMPFHRLGPHPNLPVMYASVRGSPGIVNI